MSWEYGDRVQRKQDAVGGGGGGCREHSVGSAGGVVMNVA